MTVAMAPAQVPTSAAVTAELCDMAKTARDKAMRGDYDNAAVYYGALLAKLQSVVHGISLAELPRRGRWIAMQQLFGREFEQVKAIQLELRDIALKNLQPAHGGGGGLALHALRRQQFAAAAASGSVATAAERSAHPAAFFKADPDVWSPPPLIPGRDPDVWSAPTVGDMR